MDADSVLKTVRDKYATLNSYSDEGILRIKFQGCSTSLQFKTLYLRPDKIFFQWRDSLPPFGKSNPRNEFVVWSDGKEHSFRFLGQVQSKPTLADAAASAFGVSYGSILMILNLLYPNIIELTSAWYEIENRKILNDDLVDGFDCYRVTGNEANGDIAEAWISKKDFLVRRLWTYGFLKSEHRQVDEHVLARQQTRGFSEPPSHETSMKYEYRRILVNEPISEEAFNFDQALKIEWTEYES